NLLLHDRHFFRTHLHAEIAARHHHSIRNPQNRIEIFDGLRLFQLCDHRRLFFCLADQLLRQRHIFRPSHKTDCDVVRACSKGSNTVLTRVESPSTFAVVIVNSCPVRKSTGPPPARTPVRIFGPCKSASIATVFFISNAAARSKAIFFACSACVPWEKFRRATFIPASRSFLIIQIGRASCRERVEKAD